MVTGSSVIKSNPRGTSSPPARQNTANTRPSSCGPCWEILRFFAVSLRKGALLHRHLKSRESAARVRQVETRGRHLPPHKNTMGAAEAADPQVLDRVKTIVRR